jgi:hypothetical protein
VAAASKQHEGVIVEFDTKRNESGTGESIAVDVEQVWWPVLSLC